MVFVNEFTCTFSIHIANKNYYSIMVVTKVCKKML